jgi:hypothetical protein
MQVFEEEKEDPVYCQNRLTMVACSRCGADAFSAEAWIKRQLRGSAKLCADCERTPVLVIKPKNQVEGMCRVWHGDFDWDDYPLDTDGQRFTGDVALCGHKDCINAKHRPEMVLKRPPRTIYAASMDARKRKKIAKRKKTNFSFELWLAVAEGSGQL